MVEEWGENMLDIHHLGDRIRENRKKKMMTIKNLSEYTGLSVGYLSMLEQNKTTPTIDNLAKICGALEIEFMDILETECEMKTIIRKEELMEFRYPDENLIVDVADFRRNGTIYEYITIQPGEIKKKQEYRHNRDEMCTVISGCLNLSIEGKEYVLKEKDSAYIKQGERHCIYNAGDKESVSLWVYHSR